MHVKREFFVTKEKDFIACDNSNGDNVQRVFHDRAAAREWLHDLKRSKRLQREADLKTIQEKSDNSVILSPKEKLKAQLTQKIMAKAIDKGQQLALEVSEVHNKWLNAKPCGILDSAHMTHGLNP